MDFLSYIVSLLVVAVLTYAARKWYGRDSLPSSPSTQTRIFVCVAWPGSGSPPCVSNLLSKAAWRSRICFGVCAREAVPRPNVRFVTQTSFAGASLSHAKCLSLSSGEPLVMTVDPRCDAEYGWDAEMERMLSSCPSKSVLTHLPSSSVTFPCPSRVGSRGVHCTQRRLSSSHSPVRVLFHDEACSFGTRDRFSCLTIKSPSRVTSSTASSWQMHGEGYSFYAPSRPLIPLDGPPTPADETWHVDSGIRGNGAASFRSFAGLSEDGSPGMRASIGVADPHDEEECAAKHGSKDKVREMLGKAHSWPRVVRIGGVRN